MSVNIDELMLDIDILIYGLRSVEFNDKTRTESFANTFLMSKQCIQVLEDKLIVLSNHFKREFFLEQDQKVLIESIFDDCLKPLRLITPEINDALQSLHYPLPNWLKNEDNTADHQVDQVEQSASLKFELQLFDWLSEIKQQPMDANEFGILIQEELYQQLSTMKKQIESYEQLNKQLKNTIVDLKQQLNF